MADKTLAPADARDLLMLSIARAQADGSLRGKREGRDAFYDELQLAAVLGISVRTFQRRWARWQATGWVTITGRPGMGRLERWLLPEGHDTVELKPVVSRPHATVERRAGISIRKSIPGSAARTRASARSAMPPSRKRREDPPDCLRLALDLMSRGVAVQVIKPSGDVVEVAPDNAGAGSLMRLLGTNNPSLAIAAKISDKPSWRVMVGLDQPRITARRRDSVSATGWPIDRLLGALQDIGIRPRPKGIGRWASRCPAHNRSLSGSPPANDSLLITERSDGKVAVKCYKACHWRDVLGILGLSPRDLYPRVPR